MGVSRDVNYWEVPEIRIVRDRVKTALSNTHRRLFPHYGYQPVCLWCNRPMFSRGEMHEWLVTRGDARGWSEEDRLRIFTEVNCVILHPTCHRDFGTAPEMRERICRAYLFQYGSRRLMNFLVSLPFTNTNTDEHFHFLRHAIYEQEMAYDRIYR